MDHVSSSPGKDSLVLDAEKPEEPVFCKEGSYILLGEWAEPLRFPMTYLVAFTSHLNGGLRLQEA